MAGIIHENDTTAFWSDIQEIANHWSNPFCSEKTLIPSMNDESDVPVKLTSLRNKVLIERGIEHVASSEKSKIV
jgi:hypothetical protein